MTQCFYTGKLTQPNGSGDITVDGSLSTTSENPVQNKIVTGALNNKADTSSLATVATSGDYGDLLNKPSIPSAQIQADWSQSDNTKLDFIKNKPTIPTVPTNISVFTNDAGYLTQHQDISGKQDVLTAGTNITIQNNVISASGGSDATKIDGGTVVEGLFSDLPTFISGLAGKLSNGVITYKITEDETIDATILPDFGGSVGIVVPQWSIPEVLIDGNEKTITVTSVNPYAPPVTFVPADYNMATGMLITNLNSQGQVIKIKNINLVLSGATYDHLYNSADINLKLEACTITSTTSADGAVVMIDNGLCESYYSEYITTDTSHNTLGLVADHIATVKSYSDTFKDLTFSGSAREGGQVQFIRSIYDGVTNGILCNKGGIGTLYTTSNVTGNKVLSDGTTVTGGIAYN